MTGIRAIAPSNIALIKYWGKKDPKTQWPANDSLSMTLESAVTICDAKKMPSACDHTVMFQNQWVTRQSEPKIFGFLDLIKAELSQEDFLEIKTQNLFPTGCGLASSASGYAALILAVLGTYLGKNAAEKYLEDGEDFQKLARWARLGSGSATRSLQGGFVEWKKGDTSDNQTVHQVASFGHWELHDTIVLFSDKAKSVSSSDAHLRAFTSPLFAPRLAGINERKELIKTAISDRNMQQLGPLIEQEALEMHAVMMSSDPAVFYFDKNVGEFLAWFRDTRNSLGLSCYFTMDAGPNVHLLCEKDTVEKLREILKEKFPETMLFYDRTGKGPELQWLN